ncbi:MAG TPA: alkaline phosphatase family protein, partial [Vicinamibacterales bacterium]|nr:alkaline phosphatase family protein [Vicinamibacterales bacterium]
PPLARPSAGTSSVPAFAATGTDRGRVLMLLVDGASLDYISPAAAEGRLPNFGRILDSGAVMHLATLRPTQPEPVWTSVATGKLPSQTGVRSSASYQVGTAGPSLDLLPDYCLAQALVHFGFLRQTSHSSQAVRAGTIWEILSASGIPSAVVRWPLTFPAAPIEGVLVSDQLHRAAGTAAQLNGSPVVAPAEVAVRLQTDLSPSAVAPVIGGAALDAPYPGIGSLAIDRFYSEVFHIVRQTPGVRFLAVRYQGLDTVGHYYLQQSVPHAFRGAPDEELREAGRVLEQYYRYIDDEVGRVVNLLGPDDLLLVVSAFGMEPVRLPKRLLERLLGNPELNGTHERAPDGFLMAFGSPVRPGRLPRASVLDVAPTVLYFFGLPIGRDMDGFARTDIFSRAFTEERPLTFIPSYERAAPLPGR